MAEQNKEWRVYIIGDLRTWANPQEYEERSKLERFDNFEDAKKRFNELRNLPYNSEKALNYEGEPSARLTMGVDREHAAFDILHVRAGENVLVDDFTRSPLSTDSALQTILRKTAAEIGFDKALSHPTLENGKRGKSEFVPFDKWAAENTQFNLTGGKKTMEHATKFEVSSISKIENGSSTKALASVIVNGELAVRGIKVMEGEKGAFVAMPSKMLNPEKPKQTEKKDAPAPKRSRR